MLNADVDGRDQKLVPIAALNVQVCGYDITEWFTGSDVLSGPDATHIEDETNALPQWQYPQGPTGPCGPAPSFLVTFVSDAHHVTVVASASRCVAATNGASKRTATPNWLNEMQRYTRPTTLDPTTPTDQAPTNPAGPTGLHSNDGGAGTTGSPGPLCGPCG